MQLPLSSLGRTRETEYTTVKGVRVFIGTWNVNAKKPNFDDLVSVTRYLAKRPSCLAVLTVQIPAPNTLSESSLPHRSETWRLQHSSLYL